MKFIVALFSLFLAFPSFAKQTSFEGQCVFPKTVTLKNGHLKFKNPVYLYEKPDPKSDAKLLTTYSTFTVKTESGGMIELITAPDYGLPDPDSVAGKNVGWGKKSDFELQGAINCD